ncbi:MAG: T9SS type A sorting domain-containing protein [Candidatus Marinimicrobia bacterium]|nr:T9SS type A sorting domain-containing protein [Candidatus Neomarinimicrobiota bacterium]MCF7829497.1 T9SS type A sorting domain-containing protein [Candidatus Neomarinimicrobiota bacterium]MCF7880105.1 T9SS type A sorting domain-containing protein [Candidatus Neomarinimicrobiota bacterium]
MKRFLTLFVLIFIASSVLAQVEVSSDITENTTWTADNDYLLTAQVFVKSGATLTVEPGTVIKANEDDGSGLAPALIVERGAKLIADGRADAPITFTSSLSDDQLPARGTWGGLILLGNAPINAEGGESNVEGLTGVPYGGDDPHDSSGILRYVRVWYGGRSIGQDNEINGITFAGVGDGTVVEHCEVAWNLDDGFEFFGGTVNVKYLSVLFVGDDAFDTDQGYQGKGQFLFALQGTDAAGRGFEMDNDGDNYDQQPRSYPQFHNVTLIGPGGGSPTGDGADQMIRLREGTGGDFRNVIVTEGNGYGVRITEDATFALIPEDSLNFSAENIVYGNAGAQFEIDTLGLAAQDTDPQLRSLDTDRQDGAGTIDPRPASGSAAMTGGVSLPDDGFFAQVDFVGAFGEGLWLKGLSKLDADGRLPQGATTPIAKENDALVPEAFTLSAYPNPFNPVTTIRFTLTDNAPVKVSVYNLMGQQVASLVNQQLESGIHEYQLDGSNLSSGIYFIRFETPEKALMQKVTLLK